MRTHDLLNGVYAVSADVVARKVEDAVILIPLPTGEDNPEREPFFVNMTGQAIFRMFNGKRSLKDIVTRLAAEYDCSAGIIAKDVRAFVKELLKRKLIMDVLKT